jgi:hypothetical protein
MEGIEILNMYEYQNFQPLFIVLGALIGGFLGVIIGCLVDYYFVISNTTVQGFAIVIGLFGIIIGAIIDFSIIEKETRYEVTIDDSVNYKEFTEKYEVIEVNGKIYTIVEKEVE